MVLIGLDQGGKRGGEILQKFESCMYRYVLK